MEIDAHTVAFERGGGGGDLDRIFAAADILLLEFLLRLFQHRAVEDPRLGQPGLLQAFLQLVFLEFLGADDTDLCNRRTLFDYDHQDAVLGFQPHILEETSGIKCLDCRSRLFVVKCFPHLDGQVAEHRPCLGSLYAFHPYVLDYEWFARP